MKKLIELLKLAVSVSVLVFFVLILSILTPFDDGNPKYFDPYE